MCIKLNSHRIPVTTTTTVDSIPMPKSHKARQYLYPQAIINNKINVIHALSKSSVTIKINNIHDYIDTPCSTCIDCTRGTNCNQPLRSYLYRAQSSVVVYDTKYKTTMTIPPEYLHTIRVIRCGTCVKCKSHSRCMSPHTVHRYHVIAYGG